MITECFHRCRQAVNLLNRHVPNRQGERDSTHRLLY